MKPARRVVLLAIAMVMTLIPVTPGSAATGDPVLINEVLVSTTGTDVEYIELFGTPGASLDGLSLIAVEAEGSTVGQIDDRFDFGAGDTLGSNGFYLLGTAALLQAEYGVSPNRDFPENTLENSATTFALVETASISGPAVSGSEVVLDAVAIIQTSGTFYFGAPVIGPDGTFLPAGARRVVDGVDTDTIADWAISDFNLGPDNTPTAGTVPPAGGTVLNEVLVSTTGTDVEYAELFGPAGASLAGLSLIVVESDDQSSNGAIDSRFDFAPDAVIGDNGFYLVANDLTTTTYAVTPNASIPNNFFENSSSTIALVETATIGGTSVSGSEVVVDSVALTDGEDASFFFFGAPLVSDPSGFYPAGVKRAVDGVDTDTAADFVLLDFFLGSPNDPTAGTGIEPPEPSPCAAGDVFIHTIQGSGEASECVGDTVTIEGIVVGDYEGPSPALRGFYVQEEFQDWDSDPATSEGIFVFNGSNNDVNVGDLVVVTGEVGEFQGQTQIGFPDSLDVASSGQTVPPTEISLPLTSADDFEAVEGMLVVAPQTLYVTEFFQLGRFGQVVVSSGDRLDQPTTVVEPGAEANALQAANDLNRLIIDDGENGQNPDPIVFGRGGDELTASNTLRGGDTATGTIGVMTYTWAGNSASGNAFRLRPVNALDGFINFEPTNPRPTAAPDVGGSVQVVSFNVLNYFLSTDDLGDVCGPGQDEDCRGADDVEEFERQRDKLLTALTQIDAAVVGLIELENTPGVSPEDDIAAGLNDIVGGGTYASINAAAVGGGVVGLDVIRVGMIYQPALVTPLGDPALLDFSLDSLGEDRSRTAVAQSFTENATGAVFTAVVNHFKSKSGSEIDDSGGECETNPTYADCDQGDGQGFFNATRAVHAQELVDWLATDPTGSGDSDVLIIGDLNSYAKEDPIDVLKVAGYSDLIEGEYTYVFDGQWGYLDYALASSSLSWQVTGAAPYHINADEPSVLDYNTNFKTDRHIEILYAPDEFRTSDHDPVIVGLDLNAPPSCVDAEPSIGSIWPPNHQMVDIEILGCSDADGDAITITIDSIFQDEPVNADDDGNTAPDGDGIGTSTAQVRAERNGEGDGRVYHISFTATDEFGNTTTGEVTVEVRLSRQQPAVGGGPLYDSTIVP